MSLLVFAGYVMPGAVLAESTKLAREASSKKSSAKKVNKSPDSTIKRGTRKRTAVVPRLIFSAEPSDSEIERARVFQEQLAPTSTAPVAGENAALAKALVEYKQKLGKGLGRNVDDFSALTAFLGEYPKSRWRASVELNLGLARWEAGYLSEALANWQSAWELAKNEKNEKDEKGQLQKAVADRAVSELLMQYARLGRMEELKKYFALVKGRPMFGSNEQRVDGAQIGLSCMENTPEEAFKCGPYALNTLFNMDRKEKVKNELVEKFPSTKKGTNLAQLKQLAQKMGLKYQVAKRAPGAVFVVPSLMHWKVGHFAAIRSLENGRYRITDPTFDVSSNFSASLKALESESDGYFMIPEGPLPKGWTAVDTAEAETVWGRGDSNGFDPNDKTSNCPKSGEPSCKGMPVSSAFSMNATLNIVDTPLGYSPPVGPAVNHKVNYNHLEANQPGTFTFTNLGENWSYEWVSYLTLDGSNNATVRVRGGGAEVYTYNNVSSPYPNPDLLSQAKLVVIGTDHYERRLPNGSIEVYDQPDGSGRVFLSEVIDPQSNSILLQYDANYRLTTVTDAIGQVSTVTYVSNTSGNSGFYKIASISDPFSRNCSFTYNSGNTRLVAITDMMAMSSQFAYDPSSSFINMMTTPYGSYSYYWFSTVWSGKTLIRGLQTTYPDGTNSVMQTNVGNYKSYFWDRHALELYPYDPGLPKYDNAVTYIWLQDNTTSKIERSVMSSFKKPDEGDYLYTYASQPDSQSVGPINKPTTVRFVNQNWTYQYNSIGNMTQSVDPISRRFDYVYESNGVDLKEVKNTTGSNLEYVAQFLSYNSQHLPATYRDASGRDTAYTYNTAGQVLTITDANSNVTTMTYDGDGYLTEIDGPMSGSEDITTFAYDAFGRLESITNSEGYTVDYEYDAMDRVTKVSYPDSTTEETVYDRLDAVMEKDRIGRWTKREFDSLRQMVAVVDPLGRKTQYDWCSCGALSSLIDPSGRTTTWGHNISGKITSKTYPDGSKTTYTYNLAGLVDVRTDALSQRTIHQYTADLKVSQIQYGSAINQTSNVIFTYDTNFPRPKTVQNDWGTITYNYNSCITTTSGTTTGGGKISSITNNVMASSGITYSYDLLGRVTNRSINTTANPIDWTYDAMSRVTSEVNNLGTFNYAYINNPGGASKGDTRIESISYPNGQVSKFSYFPTTLDERLRQISNLKSTGAVLSQFNYSYNPAGEITQWGQIQNNGSNCYNLGYDEAGQLTTALVSPGHSSATALNQYLYGYDLASNRSSFQKVQGIKALIGGSKTTSDVLTITIKDQALSGGQEAIAYTVQSGDTLTTIATNLAATITANPKCQALGVNAVSSGTTITINSMSPNNTSFSSSLSGGATETIQLGATTNFVENASIGGTKTTGDILTITVYDPALTGGSKAVAYTVQSGDTLTTISSGMTSAINGNTDLQTLGVTATSVGTVITINSASTNATTYAQSVSTNATETITLSVNLNAVQTVLIGGTLTTSDQLKIGFYDSGLSGGGPEVVTYTTQGGDTTTAMATGLKNAINGNSNLQAIGVSATSSGPVISIKSNSLNLTTYRNATAASVTETIRFGVPANGTTTAVIGGSTTTNDVVTITVYDAGLSGGSVSKSYTVAGGNTLTDVATGLATLINGDGNLSAAGITATSSGTVLNLKSGSINATTYSYSLSASATETVNLSNTANTLAYGCDATNALTNISAGGNARFQGTANKAIASATVKTPLVSINYRQIEGNNYKYTRSDWASTTISLGTASNGWKTAVLGGTKTTGDILTFIIGNPAISGGSVSIPYTVQSGDTLSSIATNIAAAITANSTAQSIGLSATASSTTITFKAWPTYTTAIGGGGSTETATLGPNMLGSQTVAIGGTATTSDTVSVTVSDPRLPSGSKQVTYTVASGNSIKDIASGLASAISADSDLSAIGISAASSAYLNLSYSQAFSGNANIGAGSFEASVSATDAVPSTTTTNLQLKTGSIGYSSAITGAGTETVSFGSNSNGSTKVTIGGTVTTNDVVNISAYGGSIPLGAQTVSYTVQAGNTTTSIATGLTTAINADTNLQNAGISASSSGAVITVTVVGGVGQVLVFDAVGNMVSDGTNTYTWDADNKLLQITYPGSNNRSEFTYDGLGRNVKIVERVNNSVTSTKQFIWCGSQRCEERNASNTVTAQFFARGERWTSTNYFYTTDHLGSIREFTDSSANIQGQMSFDPYGRATKLQGSLAANFQYAGYYQHAPSALNLTLFRAYNPGLGRWLSRDPVGEEEGANLYAYVNGDPIALIDPLGLAESIFGHRLGPIGRYLSDRHGHLENFGSAVALGAGTVGSALATGGLKGLLPVQGAAKCPPNGPNSSYGNMLQNSRNLASQSQMSQAGKSIAGAGSDEELRVAGRLSDQYGGEPGDWAKMTSSSYTDPTGMQIQTRWYENIKTGGQYEFKTIIKRVLY